VVRKRGKPLKFWLRMANKPTRNGIGIISKKNSRNVSHNTTKLRAFVIRS